MSELTLKTLQQRRKRRAQGLVEFALVLPILLFFIMGVIDFGRALFTYAQASSQLRQSLRMASVIGYNTPTYLNCDGMRATAQAVFFAEAPAVVNIQYYPASSFIAPTPLPPAPSYSVVYPAANGGDCVGVGGNPYNLTTAEKSSLKNGDVLRISVTTQVRMITPFFPPLLTFTLRGQRTIIKTIALVNSDYGGPTLTVGEQTSEAGTAAFEATYNAAVFAQETADANANATNTQNGVIGTVTAAVATFAAQVPPITITPSDTPTFTLTPIFTYTITNTPTLTPTPSLPRVVNVKKWVTSGGGRCTGSLGARYIGFTWSKILGYGVEGYYIYANGVLVGKTQTTTGTVNSCGKSVSKNVTNGISGCYNLNAAQWVAGSTKTYEIAAFTAGGTVIGPKSVAQSHKC
jgi:Flp pilus assembly protein TadG